MDIHTLNNKSTHLTILILAVSYNGCLIILLRENKRTVTRLANQLVVPTTETLTVAFGIPAATIQLANDKKRDGKRSESRDSRHRRI